MSDDVVVDVHPHSKMMVITGTSSSLICSPL